MMKLTNKIPKEKMSVKKAIIYLRCSTNYQTEEQGGFSIPMQLKKCEAYALLKDIEIVRVFRDEGISGKDMKNRKGILEALDFLQEGMTFIVYSISRASRNLKQMIEIVETIKARKCHFCSATEDINTNSPTGYLFFQIISAISEFESSQLSARVVDGMRARKEKLINEGKIIMKSRYGYKFIKETGNFEKVESEQTVIKLIMELRREPYAGGNHTPYAVIAKNLNEKGIKPRQRRTKSNQKWSSQSIKNIITMEKKLNC